VPVQATAPRPEPVVQHTQAFQSYAAVEAEDDAIGYDRYPHGITARPNPMTHPSSVFTPARGPAGEELLQPVRHLFKRDEPRRPWWQKIPVVGG
jgi:hypothetical protein